MDTSEFEGSPRTWPPLGMPTGSVRALLTLIVVAVVVTRLARGDDFHQDYDLLWVETLLISLAHYFTSRRFITLPPDVLRQLEDDGVIERERHPLFLPRNSIRLLVVAAFGWLTYFLYASGRLFENDAISLLALLSAFFLGAVVRTIITWWNRGRVPPSAGTWGDLKALFVIVALLMVAVPEFLGSPNIFSPVVYRVALGMMLYYFGSR